MVTVTSYVLINIFQTVHFSAVKFTSGNEKNVGFLLIPKFEKRWKTSEVIRPGSFNDILHRMFMYVDMLPIIIFLKVITASTFE